MNLFQCTLFMDWAVKSYDFLIASLYWLNSWHRKVVPVTQPGLYNTQRGTCCQAAAVNACVQAVCYERQYRFWHEARLVGTWGTNWWGPRSSGQVSRLHQIFLWRNYSLSFSFNIGFSLDPRIIHSVNIDYGGCSFSNGFTSYGVDGGGVWEQRVAAYFTVQSRREVTKKIQNNVCFLQKKKYKNLRRWLLDY